MENQSIGKKRQNLYPTLDVDLPGSCSIPITTEQEPCTRQQNQNSYDSDVEPGQSVDDRFPAPAKPSVVTKKKEQCTYQGNQNPFLERYKMITDDGLPSNGQPKVEPEFRDQQLLDPYKFIESQLQTLSALYPRITGYPYGHKTAEYFELESTLDQLLVDLDCVDVGADKCVRNLRRMTIKNVLASMEHLESKLHKGASEAASNVAYSLVEPD